LERVWRLVVDRLGDDAPADPALEKALHRTIKKVEADTLGLRFNTAISAMMTFVNDATAAPKLSRPVLKTFVKVLSPYAPHLAEELWSRLGETSLVCLETWPKFDAALVVDDVVPYAVQINGKLRAEIRISATAAEAEVRAAAEANDKVKAALEGKTLRKFVFVPKRLVNFVVG
jgi:leucyl-tRNA synthetase